MGRSVSYPSGAHVAFALWDAGWIEDEDDPDTRHFDQLAAQDDWDFIVEDFREQVLALYPSTWTASGWIGREDRIVAMNRYARFGISEYCGCGVNGNHIDVFFNDHQAARVFGVQSAMVYMEVET